MTQLEFDELQKQAREKERESAQAILREANALRDEYKKNLHALKERARIQKMEFELDTAKRRALIEPDPLKAEKRTRAEAFDIKRFIASRMENELNMQYLDPQSASIEFEITNGEAIFKVKVPKIEQV